MPGDSMGMGVICARKLAAHTAVDIRQSVQEALNLFSLALRHLHTIRCQVLMKCSGGKAVNLPAAAAVAEQYHLLCSQTCLALAPEISF